MNYRKINHDKESQPWQNKKASIYKVDISTHIY